MPAIGGGMVQVMMVVSPQPVIVQAGQEAQDRQQLVGPGRLGEVAVCRIVAQRPEIRDLDARSQATQEFQPERLQKSTPKIAAP